MYYYLKSCCKRHNFLRILYIIGIFLIKSFLAVLASDLNPAALDSRPPNSTAPSLLGSSKTTDITQFIRTDPTLDNSNSSDPRSSCPTNAKCASLGGNCIKCNFDSSCIYGKDTSVSCSARAEVDCIGDTNFTRQFNCRYCYQSEPKDYVCLKTFRCRSISAPVSYYLSNCTVKDQVICMGRRVFLKKIRCNWTRGYRWSTALLLSITLGGFGVDRFYLGLWQEGIGKLFSFGGLGVWTLVDVVLIATGYIGPADGSLYIY